MRLKFVLVAAGMLTLAGAPGAAATVSSSSNWGGYAVHRSGVHFRSVFAVWRQPRLTCAAGSPSYSAFWVGIGGYRLSSNALEQVGTEADCTASGHATSSAWFELVPAASKPLKLTVHPGDQIAGAVTVSGHRVSVALVDLTTHRSAQRTLHAPKVDDTSAEWIAEAPSDCANANSCRTLPLADFGSTSFSAARARTTTGHLGSIVNRAWGTTKITLGGGVPRYAGAGGGSGAATPSDLTNAGTTFSISYSAVRAPGAPVFASQRLRLVH